jgi:hypothetical protein
MGAGGAARGEEDGEVVHSGEGKPETRNRGGGRSSTRPAMVLWPCVHESASREGRKSSASAFVLLHFQRA